jgi:hypothetical protein
MAITAKFLADFDAFKASVQGAEGSLKSLEASGTQLGKGFESLKGTAASLAGAFGIAFSVGALVQFGRSVLEAGDQIQKMADQTGLSTDEVQKFQYVAGQSGTSVESLVGAVQNLQQRLGDDSSGAAGAMAKLGVNAKAFNGLDTYAQMTTLAEGVRGIKDPTEQASLAAALFGKTWKEILPAIKGGMTEVGDQAPIMAASTVKALDEIGDAQNRAKAIAVTWGGEAVVAIEKMGFALGDYLSRFNPEHFGLATSEILKMAGALNDPSGLAGALGSIPAPAKAVGDGLADMTLSLGATKLAEMELTASAEALIVTNKRLAKEQEAAWKIEQASVELSTSLWNDHYRELRDEGLSSVEVQKNAVKDWGDDQKAKIDYNAANWKQVWDGIEVTVKDRLDGIDRATRNLGDTADETCVRAKTGFDLWNEAIMGVTRSLDGTIKSTKELAAERAKGGSTQYDLSTSEGRGKVPDDIAVYLHNGYSFEQASRLAYAIKNGMDIGNDPLFRTKGPRVPGFASGVENFGGGLAMVGERGPELVHLPGGSDVIPLRGGGGGSVTVHMTVSGLLLSGSPAGRAEFAKFATDAITQQLLASGWRPPLGARR